MTPTELRAWQDASGLSATAAAAAVGISRRYYTYLLAGRTSAGLPIAKIPRRIELAWREAARQLEKNRTPSKKPLASAH